MLKEFPEVENIVRTNNWGETIIRNNEQSFTENAFVEADSSFFDIFTVKLISGENKTALNAPHKLVLSKSTAKKIFGNENPMGKSLKVGTDSVLYTVTGIIRAGRFRRRPQQGPDDRRQGR